MDLPDKKMTARERLDKELGKRSERDTRRSNAMWNYFNTSGTEGQRRVFYDNVSIDAITRVLGRNTIIAAEDQKNIDALRNEYLIEKSEQISTRVLIDYYQSANLNDLSELSTLMCVPSGMTVGYRVAGVIGAGYMMKKTLNIGGSFKNASVQMKRMANGVKYTELEGRVDRYRYEQHLNEDWLWGDMLKSIAAAALTGPGDHNLNERFRHQWSQQGSQNELTFAIFSVLRMREEMERTAIMEGLKPEIIRRIWDIVPGPSDAFIFI